MGNTIGGKHHHRHHHENRRTRRYKRDPTIYGINQIRHNPRQIPFWRYDLSDDEVDQPPPPISICNREEKSLTEDQLGLRDVFKKIEIIPNSKISYHNEFIQSCSTQDVEDFLFRPLLKDCKPLNDLSKGIRNDKCIVCGDYHLLGKIKYSDIELVNLRQENEARIHYLVILLELKPELDPNITFQNGLYSDDSYGNGSYFDSRTLTLAKLAVSYRNVDDLLKLSQNPRSLPAISDKQFRQFVHDQLDLKPDKICQIVKNGVELGAYLFLPNWRQSRNGHKLTNNQLRLSDIYARGHTLHNHLLRQFRNIEHFYLKSAFLKKKKTCSICLIKIEKSHSYFHGPANCEHQVCLECGEHLLHHILDEAFKKDSLNYEIPRCPVENCRQVIVPSFIQALLEHYDWHQIPALDKVDEDISFRDIQRQIHERIVQTYGRHSPFSAFCPQKDCSNYILLDPQTELNRNCHSCKKNGLFQGPIRKKEKLLENKEVKSLLKRNYNFRACPNCGKIIERVEGCSSMRCNWCNKGFNWNNANKKASNKKGHF